MFIVCNFERINVVFYSRRTTQLPVASPLLTFSGWGLCSQASAYGFPKINLCYRVILCLHFRTTLLNTLDGPLVISKLFSSFVRAFCLITDSFNFLLT